MKSNSCLAPAQFACFIWVCLVATHAVAQDENTCTPQPDCRVLYSPLLPGAPTPGLENRGYTVPAPDREVIPNDLRNAQPLNRDTYHLPDTPSATYYICHGEDEERCGEHPYKVFEDCRGGGADPNRSGRQLCGSRRFGFRGLTSTSGGQCGYSWFAVYCF